MSNKTNDASSSKNEIVNFGCRLNIAKIQSSDSGAAQSKLQLLAVAE